jgi:hypothetical protein
MYLFTCISTNSIVTTSPIQGYELLRHRHGVKNLFLAGSGKEFTSTTFTQYWKTVMKKTISGDILEYFPPSAARNAFIEDYTGRFGDNPDLWEGAAMIMGNTVAQWEKTYYRKARRRGLMQRAVEAHSTYMQSWQGPPP